MKTYQLHFAFTHVPPVLRRGRHALILLQNEDGNYVLGAKKLYPQGIFRLVGGGIEGEEDPTTGAVRELQEEFGLKYSRDQLTPLAQIRATISETSTGRAYEFTTFLYLAHCVQKDLHPSDDLDGMETFSREEVNALVDRFYDLSDELVSLKGKYAEQDEWAFRWSDYGKYYGRVHEIAMELA
jgi:ADP-ribose pyrophosphatase YjhB (NUDIX family)